MLWGHWNEIFTSVFFSQEHLVHIQEIAKTMCCLVHHYYMTPQQRNNTTIFRLHVITFNHSRVVRNLFPPVQNPFLYTTYFHQLECHVPPLYRLFPLIELSSEKEESS